MYDIDSYIAEIQKLFLDKSDHNLILYSRITSELVSELIFIIIRRFRNIWSSAPIRTGYRGCNLVLLATLFPICIRRTRRGNPRISFLRGKRTCPALGAHTSMDTTGSLALNYCAHADMQRDFLRHAPKRFSLNWDTLATHLPVIWPIIWCSLWLCQWYIETGG